MSRVFISKIDSDNLEEKILESLKWIDWEKIIQKNSRVFIKPNFTFPTYKPGVTTSPQFLETLVKVLKSRSSNITIGETDGGYYAWKAEKAFQGHNLYNLKKRYDIKVINLYDSEVKNVELKRGSKVYNIPLPKLLLEDVDVFISAPVLKVHNMTKSSFGLKNQWGCILDPFRMRYHPIFKEAVLKLNEVLAPKILVSDPFYILTDKGPMAGRALNFNTLIVSNDIFAFEKVGCKILGVEPEDVDYLAYAAKKGKIPSFDSIDTNVLLEKFYTQKFNIRLSLKDRFIRRVFKSQLLTYLLYYSNLGILIHKVYYFLIGKKNKISF